MCGMNGEDRTVGHPCSGLPKIDQIPEFRSAIPREVMDKLDPKYQALFDAISRIERHADWDTSQIVPMNRVLHVLCDRVVDLEQQIEEMNSDRQIESARYSWLKIVGGGIGGAILLKLGSIAVNLIWP